MRTVSSWSSVMPCSHTCSKKRTSGAWLIRQPGKGLNTTFAVAQPKRSATFGTSTQHHFKQARFRLKLTAERAEGVIAGYVDVEAFNNHLNTSWSTHHQSYGQLSAPSLYRALRRLADGYPDAKTGQMSAISSAMGVKMVQVYVEHPPQQTVSAPAAAPASASSSR